MHYKKSTRLHPEKGKRLKRKTISTAYSKERNAVRSSGGHCLVAQRQRGSLGSTTWHIRCHLKRVRLCTSESCRYSVPVHPVLHRVHLVPCILVYDSPLLRTDVRRLATMLTRSILQSFITFLEMMHSFPYGSRTTP